MGELYDAPNQQVVRADGSGPADEGTGGSVGEPEPDQQAQAQQAEQPQPEQQQAEQQQLPPEKPAVRRRAKPDTQNP